MTELTDPTTADAAAERVQAWLDEWSIKVQSNFIVTGCGRAEPDGCTELTAPDIDALLDEHKQRAVELPLFDSEPRKFLTAWIDAGQPHTIAVAGGYVLTVAHLHKALADRARMAAELEQVRAERAANDERAEYAIDLLIAVTSPDRCMVDGFKRCLVHGEDLSSGNDCPQALARAFLAGAEAHRSAEMTATYPADGPECTASAEGAEATR